VVAISVPVIIRGALGLRIVAIIQISVVVRSRPASTLELTVEHGAAIGRDRHRARPAIVAIGQFQFPDWRAAIGATLEQKIDPVEWDTRLLRFLVGDGEGALGIQVELVLKFIGLPPPREVGVRSPTILPFDTSSSRIPPRARGSSRTTFHTGGVGMPSVPRSSRT